MTSSEHEITILRAAANILRDAGLDRVTEARTMDERRCANAALLASVTVTDYLNQLEELNQF